MTEPTIYELSSPGRTGVTFPDPDVPLAQTAGRPAAQGTALARTGRSGCRPPLHQPVEIQLQRGRRLLSAGFLHDEVQPEDQRGYRPPARLRLHPSAPADRDRPGQPGF